MPFDFKKVCLRVDSLTKRLSEAINGVLGGFDDLLDAIDVGCQRRLRLTADPDQMSNSGLVLSKYRTILLLVWIWLRASSFHADGAKAAMSLLLMKMRCAVLAAHGLSLAAC